VKTLYKFVIGARCFIGRNLAWWGLWILAPKHLRATGDLPEVIVQLPGLESRELESIPDLYHPIGPPQLRLPVVLNLYPGRFRILGAGQ
jgi:hypothetical protein